LRLEACEAEARAVLAGHRGNRGGELRIGLGNAMPGMAMIRAFQAQHPRIQVSVVMGDFGTIVAAVEAQRVDVGLLPEVPEDGRFRREVCLTQRVVAIVPPEHPLAGQPAVACRDLADGRLVFRPRSSSTQRVVDRAFRRAGILPRPALVLDTRDGVVEAVANGLGIGFMWALASSRTNGLVRLSMTEAPDEMPEHVFALASRRNALVDLFFETRHRMTLEPKQAALAG
jgi:DNA-binding transcriptional LysR family regulator